MFFCGFYTSFRIDNSFVAQAFNSTRSSGKICSSPIELGKKRKEKIQFKLVPALVEQALQVGMVLHIT